MKKRSQMIFIPRDIAGKLLCPVIAVRLRYMARFAVGAVLVPETTVDEHSHSLGGERDVRPARSSFPVLSVTTLSHLSKRAS